MNDSFAGHHFDNRNATGKALRYHVHRREAGKDLRSLLWKGL